MFDRHLRLVIVQKKSGHVTKVSFLEVKKRLIERSGREILSCRIREKMKFRRRGERGNFCLDVLRGSERVRGDSERIWASKVVGLSNHSVDSLSQNFRYEMETILRDLVP